VEIQRDFMADSTRKLAAIALIIEKEARERELTEAQDRIDAWWKETAEKELEENKRLMEMFQQLAYRFVPSPPNRVLSFPSKMASSTFLQLTSRDALL
jgi:hypothetical protein